MSEVPDILGSAIEERREYINNRFPCIADCDMCGLCKVFHGNDPEFAYDDYINGRRSFEEGTYDIRPYMKMEIKGVS